MAARRESIELPSPKDWQYGKVPGSLLRVPILARKRNAFLYET